MSVKHVSASLASPRLNLGGRFLSGGLEEGSGEAGGEQFSFMGSREHRSSSHTQGTQMQSRPVSLLHGRWWVAGSVLCRAGSVPLPVPWQQTGLCPCSRWRGQVAQTSPPGSLCTAWFSSVFLEASALCSSLGTFVLTFAQVCFGPHMTVLR